MSELKSEILNEYCQRTYPGFVLIFELQAAIFPFVQKMVIYGQNEPSSHHNKTKKVWVDIYPPWICTLKKNNLTFNAALIMRRTEEVNQILLMKSSPVTKEDMQTREGDQL